MSDYKNRLLELAESFRRKNHRYSEDPWYACPLNEEYCGNSTTKECDCGLEENNQRVDELIDLINHLEVVEDDRLTEPE